MKRVLKSGSNSPTIIGMQMFFIHDRHMGRQRHLILPSQTQTHTLVLLSNFCLSRPFFQAHCPSPG